MQVTATLGYEPVSEFLGDVCDFKSPTAAVLFAIAFLGDDMTMGFM